VRGGQQNDVLTGGAGDDYLSGDRDNDTVTGGAGADVFHTFGAAGLDRITDFSLADGDRVQLDPGDTWTLAQVGGDAVVTISGQAQLVLAGVQASSLTGAWIFGG
jgi:serralysin